MIAVLVYLALLVPLSAAGGPVDEVRSFCKYVDKISPSIRKLEAASRQDAIVRALRTWPETILQALRGLPAQTGTLPTCTQQLQQLVTFVHRERSEETPAEIGKLVRFTEEFMSKQVFGCEDSRGLEQAMSSYGELIELTSAADLATTSRLSSALRALVGRSHESMRDYMYGALDLNPAVQGDFAQINAALDKQVIKLGGICQSAETLEQVAHLVEIAAWLADWDVPKLNIAHVGSRNSGLHERFKSQLNRLEDELQGALDKGRTHNYASQTNPDTTLETLCPMARNLQKRINLFNGQKVLTNAFLVWWTILARVRHHKEMFPVRGDPSRFTNYTSSFITSRTLPASFCPQSAARAQAEREKQAREEAQRKAEELERSQAQARAEREKKAQAEAQQKAEELERSQAQAQAQRKKEDLHPHVCSEARLAEELKRKSERVEQCEKEVSELKAQVRQWQARVPTKPFVRDQGTVTSPVKVDHAAESRLRALEAENAQLRLSQTQLHQQVASLQEISTREADRAASLERELEKARTDARETAEQLKASQMKVLALQHHLQMAQATINQTRLMQDKRVADLETALANENARVRELLATIAESNRIQASQQEIIRALTERGDVANNAYSQERKNEGRNGQPTHEGNNNAGVGTLESPTGEQSSKPGISLCGLLRRRLSLRKKPSK